MELGGQNICPTTLSHMFGTLGVNLPHLPHLPHHPNRPNVTCILIERERAAVFLPDKKNKRTGQSEQRCVISESELEISGGKHCFKSVL
jgi:hypothetical protein